MHSGLHRVPIAAVGQEMFAVVLKNSREGLPISRNSRETLFT